MRIDLTKLPVNQADKNATYMDVDWINEADGTISGTLYDSEGNVVARRRVYSYSGGYKNIPFADLAEPQKAYLRGDEPDDKWDAYLVGQWLDKRNIERPEQAKAADMLKLVPILDNTTKN